MATAAERKAAERDRKRKAGLRKYEVWLHPSEWPAVKRYIERISKRHASQL